MYKGKRLGYDSDERGLKKHIISYYNKQQARMRLNLI